MLSKMRVARIPQDEFPAHPEASLQQPLLNLSAAAADSSIGEETNDAMAADESDEDATSHSNVPTVAFKLAAKSTARTMFRIPADLAQQGQHSCG